MPSNINPQNINTTYPIAGQDNDTQGFRTNFTNIQNNFTVASSEITALQGNVAQLQTEIITGNITVQGNVITSTIISPAGSNANIVINPDNSADVVFPASTELYVQSGAVSTNQYTGAIVVAGGIGVCGNINANTVTVTSAIQFANLTTTQINAIAPTTRGMTVYNYTTGNIQVYNGTKWANITLS
jgi:hypothetical protein